MPFLGFFRLKFDETIVIPEISTLELVKMHEFVQNKKKKSNLGQKMSFLDILVLLFLKTIVIFEIGTLELVKMQSCLHK